jgi:hypothetical protein
MYDVGGTELKLRTYVRTNSLWLEQIGIRMYSIDALKIFVSCLHVVRDHHVLDHRNGALAALISCDLT